MGFHMLDIIVIAGLALLIFGPKTMQSLSHTLGRGVRQAGEVKDKLMADVPVDEFINIRDTVSQIPLTPQQAARQIAAFASDEEKVARSDKANSEEPASYIKTEEPTPHAKLEEPR